MNTPESTPQELLAEIIPFPSVVEKDRDLREIANALRIALEMMSEADYQIFLSRLRVARPDAAG